MGIEKDIDELLSKGVIDQVTAESLRFYYRRDSSSSHNRQVLIFGLLGSILAGTGLVLIIAHNWDDLSTLMKLFFAALPLLIGQSLVAYTLIKQKESRMWREASSVFLLFAVGSFISLVAQIYHIPGDLRSFLLAWVLLVIPLVYIVRASFVNLLCIAGITWYAGLVGFEYGGEVPWNYLWLILITIPHFLRLLTEQKKSNFTVFHQWFLVLSVLIILPTFNQELEELILPGYLYVGTIFYQLGQSKMLSKQSLRRNAFLVLGSLAMVVSLLASTFSSYWEEVAQLKNTVSSFPESLVLLITFIISTLLILLRFKRDQKVSFQSLVFIIFTLIFLASGINEILPIFLSNFLLLALSVVIIKKGIDSDHLGILNYGLFVITALILCRFFDQDLSFVLRGFIFLIVGFGFFYVNYRVIKNRKRKGFES